MVFEEVISMEVRTYFRFCYCFRLRIICSYVKALDIGMLDPSKMLLFLVFILSFANMSILPKLSFGNISIDVRLRAWRD